MIITVSERQFFLRCRRMWDIISHNRQNLSPIGAPKIELYIGGAFHGILDEQAKGVDHLEAVDQVIAHEIGGIKERYRSAVGVDLSDSEVTIMTEAEDLIRGLAGHYFAFYGTEHPLGEEYQYIGKEMSFQLPIPNTGVSEEIGYLAGTFDGLAIHIATDGLWVVEHKTYKMKPKYEFLQTNDQMTAYVWAAQILMGVPVQGVLYDGVRKKLPEVPVLLKNGTLSKQFISTTAAVYRGEIARRGFSETSYQDILGRLQERDSQDQNEFFTRWRVRVSPRAIEDFERNLTNSYLDMVSSPNIYPTFRWEGCWDCGVRNMCTAIHFGEDVDFVRTNSFRRADPYRTLRSDRYTVDESGEIISLPVGVR